MTTQTIVELAPANKGHTTDYKSLTDHSFYGIVHAIEKEFKDGWVINGKEYPLYDGYVFNVSVKREKGYKAVTELLESGKGLEATLAPPSSLKAPVRAARAVKEPSARRKSTVTTKVVSKAAKASLLSTPAVVDSAPDKFTYKEI